MSVTTFYRSSAAAQAGGHSTELLPLVPYAVVFTALAWRLPIFRVLIYPIKLIVTIVHEVGHLIAGVIEGNRCIGYSADPHKGGQTKWLHPSGDRACDFFPEATVPAGYAANLIIGSASIYCAFDGVLAYRALIGVTTVLGISLLYYDNINTLILPAVWLSVCGRLLTLPNAAYMQAFVCVLGLLCNLYTPLDVMDELVWAKERPSCISLHAKWLPYFSKLGWNLIWNGAALAASALALKAGLKSTA